jgi:hypothetical protein
MNPDPPEQLDWIKVRSECTVAQVFEKLLLEIQGDVEQVNSSQTNRKFKIVREGEFFSVFQDGLLIGHRGVMVRRAQQSIEVTSFINGDETKEVAVATIVVNDLGKCLLAF